MRAATPTLVAVKCRRHEEHNATLVAKRRHYEGAPGEGSRDADDGDRDRARRPTVRSSAAVHPESDLEEQHEHADGRVPRQTTRSSVEDESNEDAVRGFRVRVMVVERLPTRLPGAPG